jgi:hypothetical protein
MRISAMLATRAPKWYSQRQKNAGRPELLDSPHPPKRLSGRSMDAPLYVEMETEQYTCLRMRYMNHAAAVEGRIM